MFINRMYANHYLKMLNHSIFNHIKSFQFDKNRFFSSNYSNQLEFFGKLVILAIASEFQRFNQHTIHRSQSIWHNLKSMSTYFGSFVFESLQTFCKWCVRIHLQKIIASSCTRMKKNRIQLSRLCQKKCMEVVENYLGGQSIPI